MMVRDSIFFCCLFYIFFVDCTPWKQDEWDQDISLLLKAHDIALAYEDWEVAEFGNAYQTTDIAESEVAKKLKFDRAKEGEAPYTSLIYGYPDSAKTQGPFTSDSLPLLGSCGGIMITTDTLLTLCACVATWLTWMRDTRGLGEFKQNYSAIISDYDIPSKDIYVWNGDPRFAPWNQDWRIKLSTDPDKQYLNNDWCYEAVENCSIEVHICQRANPAVLKVDIPWTYSPKVMIPWPPSQFYYTSENIPPPLHIRAYVRAYFYSYKFETVDSFEGELFDEFGTPIDIGLYLVGLNITLDNKKHCEPYDDCLAEDKCPEAKKWDLKTGITCFTGERKPEICRGSYGSPIYSSSFGLHGLAMTSYPCGRQTSNKEESSILEVMAITPRMSEYLETRVPDLVDSSKESDPHWHLRRDISDYRVYEMVTYKFLTLDDPSPDELNKAAIVELHFGLFPFIIVFLSGGSMC